LWLILSFHTPTTSHPSQIQLPPIHIALCTAPYHEANNNRSSYTPTTSHFVNNPVIHTKPSQPNNPVIHTKPSQTPYHDQTKSKQSASHPHTAKHPRTKKANPVKSWLFYFLLLKKD
jgi:hypothetical protein